MRVRAQHSFNAREISVDSESGTPPPAQRLEARGIAVGPDTRGLAVGLEAREIAVV